VVGTAKDDLASHVVGHVLTLRRVRIFLRALGVRGELVGGRLNVPNQGAAGRSLADPGNSSRVDAKLVGVREIERRREWGNGNNDLVGAGDQGGRRFVGSSDANVVSENTVAEVGDEKHCASEDEVADREHDGNLG